LRQKSGLLVAFCEKDYFCQPTSTNIWIIYSFLFPKCFPSCIKVCMIHTFSAQAAHKPFANPIRSWRSRRCLQFFDACIISATAEKCMAYFLSQSRIRYFDPSPHGVASRSCCAVYSSADEPSSQYRTFYFAQRRGHFYIALTPWEFLLCKDEESVLYFCVRRYNIGVLTWS